MAFRFIDIESTDFTALDANEIDELPCSGIFMGSSKELSFRLGNLGSDPTDFHVSAESANDVLDFVTFSKDEGATWESDLYVSGIEPNGITQALKVRFSPTSDALVGVGSFVIDVEEL